MTSRPDRYLSVDRRSGVIYYDRGRGPTRDRFSLLTTNVVEARKLRDEYLRESARPAGPPTFAGLAGQYLEAVRPSSASRYRLSHAHYDDRKAALTTGRVGMQFGEIRVADIGKAELAEFVEVLEAAGLAPSTIDNALKSVSAVLRYAARHDWIPANPVPIFRESSGFAVTKATREEADEDRRNPIRPAIDMARFVLESERAGAPTLKRNGQRRIGHVAVMLMLDAGLRLGEAHALEWSDLDFDRRIIHVRRSIARGKYKGAPKSGRGRRVDMSNRLATILRRWRLQVPAAEERVLTASFHPSNFRNRHFAKIVEKLGFEDRRYNPKSLRHSYASWLLSAGVSLEVIQQQLGHSSVTTTERSYAKWTSETYRAPIPLEPGEVPADTLAKIEHRALEASESADASEKGRA